MTSLYATVLCRAGIGKAWALAALLGIAALPARAQLIYGLASNKTLVSFTGINPNVILDVVPVTGIPVSQLLVGLDSRPATNELYALGYDASTQTGQVYVIDPVTGQAARVGNGPVALPLGGPSARIGFDFTPTADRIRVVSSQTRANLRLHPVTGALEATDTPLAYAPTDTNAGQLPSVEAVAYTNSYIGATATALYALDAAANRLLTQNPPDSGILRTVGTLGTATSGNGQIASFDAYFNPMTFVNYAYLSVAERGIGGSYSTQLHVLNLTTASTFLSGTVGNGNVMLTDIAVQAARPVPLPAVTGQLVYALAGSQLLTFDSTNPGLIRTSEIITGVDPAQTLVGLDLRPATNELYALGYNATTQTASLYTLNATTGAAQVLSATPVALPLGPGSIGFDFDPITDQIRVVGANRANFRLLPTSGAIAASDGQLTYAPGDVNAAVTPSIGAVAHTNSMAGAGSTQLLAYDELRNVLALQTPPTSGTLRTVGASSLLASVSRDLDLDIYGPAAGYLVANAAAGGNSTFYTLNTATGLATPVGIVGNGIVIRDIAVTGAGGVTGVRLPNAVSRLSLHPNPLRDATEIGFELLRTAHVTLTITDALGRVVSTLDAGLLPPGYQRLGWNGAGRAAGTYFFQLRLDGRPAGTRRASLLE